MRAQRGRSATPTDALLLHVLGPTGSVRFLDAFAGHPSASSLTVASADVLRNAGLLSHDGQPMTVARTYGAIRAMLNAQRNNSALLMAAADKTGTP